MNFIYSVVLVYIRRKWYADKILKNVYFNDNIILIVVIRTIAASRNEFLKIKLRIINVIIIHYTYYLQYLVYLSFYLIDYTSYSITLLVGNV